MRAQSGRVPEFGYGPLINIDFFQVFYNSAGSHFNSLTYFSNSKDHNRSSKRKKLLFKKIDFKQSNLNATNAYLQLDTGTRPGKLYAQSIQSRISLASKLRAPGKRGTFAWIAGTVQLREALFCFVLSEFFFTLTKVIYGSVSKFQVV